MRRLVTSIGLALAIGLIPLASAAAHECIVVNRSANGNTRCSANSLLLPHTRIGSVGGPSYRVECETRRSSHGSSTITGACPGVSSNRIARGLCSRRCRY